MYLAAIYSNKNNVKTNSLCIGPGGVSLFQYTPMCQPGCQQENTDTQDETWIPPKKKCQSLKTSKNHSANPVYDFNI